MHNSTEFRAVPDHVLLLFQVLPGPSLLSDSRLGQLGQRLVQERPREVERLLDGEGVQRHALLYQEG